VYGTHGLNRYGLESASQAKGFYGHDLIADIVRRSTPDLSFTTGVDGSIEANPSFVVEQCAFPTPTTGEAALLEVNKHYLWEWGVYDDRQFFWRPADPGRSLWEARLDAGAFLGLEGDDADNAINGVMVVYNLPDGKQRFAGPVGSGLDITNAALGDASESNPVNMRGIPRKWAKLELSFPTTDDGAVQIGAVYLAELALPARKGQITLTGRVDHVSRGRRPVAEVRAGDWIRISDHPADVPRRIVQVSHSDDSRSCEIDVGNDVDKVDAILNRLGAKTSLVEVS
jgi:hypothetical protein